MKQKLNQLPFDEHFQAVFDAISDKLAKKISTNFKLAVIEESLEEKTKSLIEIST